MTKLITTKLGGHAAASCLLGDLSAVRATGVLSGVIKARPAVAQVAAATQAQVYVAPTLGADVEQKWAEGNLFFGATSAAERRQMTAFRGLEPWRDPT